MYSGFPNKCAAHLLIQGNFLSNLTLLGNTHLLDLREISNQYVFDQNIQKCIRKCRITIVLSHFRALLLRRVVTGLLRLKIFTTNFFEFSDYLKCNFRESPSNTFIWSSIFISLLKLSLQRVY